MTDDAVVANIQRGVFDRRTGSYPCGCQEGLTEWFLCSYHEGYGDGYDAAKDMTCGDRYRRQQ